MLVHEQCEIARVMTKDTVTDDQIRAEYDAFPVSSKPEVNNRIGALIKAHNGSFDVAYPIIAQDFLRIGQEYHVSPATLFCIYMERKAEKN